MEVSNELQKDIKNHIDMERVISLKVTADLIFLPSFVPKL